MTKTGTILFLVCVLALTACQNHTENSGAKAEPFLSGNNLNRPDGSKNTNPPPEKKALKPPADPPDEITVQPEPTDASTVELHFVGDVMMDSFIGDYIREQGVDYPWTQVTPVLRKADLAVANLETSVSTRGSTKKPEGYGFRSAPETLKGLKNSGFDFVSLANNHVLDFGVDAFGDTLKHLEAHGIQYAGAGSNRTEAEEVKIIEKNGLKIGFLSYTSIIPYNNWISDENRPGIAPLIPSQFERMLDHIEKADSRCDILILLLHWGTEHVDHPEPWQTKLAHRIIDRGADAIVGHHPHVLQPIEFYKNKPILYSTGNFVFLKKNDKAGRSAIFKMKFNREGFVEGAIDPIYIKYCKARLLDANDEMRQNIIQNVAELSKEHGTLVQADGQFSSLNVPSPDAAADAQF